MREMILLNIWKSFLTSSLNVARVALILLDLSTKVRMRPFLPEHEVTLKKLVSNPEKVYYILGRSEQKDLDSC